MGHLRPSPFGGAHAFNRIEISKWEDGTNQSTWRKNLRQEIIDAWRAHGWRTILIHGKHISTMCSMGGTVTTFSGR